MAVAWYGVKVYQLTSPDGTRTITGTKPTHTYTWEMWTLTKDDGSQVQIPQRVRRKYQDVVTGVAMAYDQEVEGAVPTVALLRVEYPDAMPAPLEVSDYIVFLNTEAKWESAMAQYPTLKYRFADQPYYPAVG